MLQVIKNFLKRIISVCFSGMGLLFLISMSSYNHADPSFNNAIDNPPSNLLGYFGSYSADILWQFFGITIIPLLLFLIVFGIKFGINHEIKHFFIKLISSFCASLLIFVLFSNNNIVYKFGLNRLGFIFSKLEVKLDIFEKYPYPLYALLILLIAFFLLFSLDAFKIIKYLKPTKKDTKNSCPDFDDIPVIIAKKDDEQNGYEENKEKEHLIGKKSFLNPFNKKKKEEKDIVKQPSKKVIIEKNDNKNTSSIFGYIPPSLNFLANQKDNSDTYVSKEIMLETGAKLQKVLNDFDIKGRIINFRSGPIVTLYEFEPAVGIRSSRIIGLSDDIARAMSIVSVRISVLPGTNLMGIEVPNEKRKTVLLKELVNTDEYKNNSGKLCLALGKDITGKPVYANLEKMPHLLVAGTTGSGKSVAINTIILSLLYRLSPEECRLIMIDPKMLELSIYNDIPHLLTPVVTEPSKAVFALKWAVKEMNNRYRLMSDLQVRGIDGYNQKVKEMLKNKASLSRTVQTGFDESGKPITETIEKELKPLPFIVIIIDEMADLMLFAKKDINDLVQSLAQKARAAGMHVITATQRPSVDVITGVIKANFPTRISFQVTSKIDSRTILNEQGAEQLLGMGDMLYLMPGKKSLRVHGPFVSDNEVENITNYLRSLAPADYVDDVTVDEKGENDDAFSDSSFDNSEKDIYNQAVNVVMTDRKVSTSYIQRKLNIGYNKAATIIERMEQEGIISKADRVGRREILM